MVNWTEDQKRAIDTRGGKIIVSAAAGSGKTAVLSERVINYILNGGDINRLLIVTFTKLAASEMKERIKANIDISLNKDPSNEHLLRQSLLVENAKIMTMDAFYNMLIKENFAILKIKPDFKVIDEIEHNIIKDNIVKTVINNDLAHDDTILIKLLDNFSDYKNGTTIEQLVISFNEFINKMPFPEQWLESFRSVYNTVDFNNSVWSNLLYDDLFLNIDSYSKLYNEAIDEIGQDDLLYEKLFPFLTNEVSSISLLSESIVLKNMININSIIKSFTFERFPTIKDTGDNPLCLRIKVLRDNLKKLIKNYQDNIDYLDEDKFLSDLLKQKELIDGLILITNKYRHELKTVMTKDNILSFDDVPHLVLDLLIKNYDYTTKKYEKTDYATTLAQDYDEILIDEFQDTNMVQNLIFASLSNDNKNLFIVGDVKQSIYGFRSARPDLLTNEKNNANSDSFPMLITLGQNFRSRKEVLGFCNYLFSKIMTSEFGEVLYDDSEQLNLGAEYQESLITTPELYLLTNNSEVENEDDLSKVEKEAIFVAKKIKDLINSNYQVYDNKNRVFRDIKLSDIAILLRSVSNRGEIFRNALINEGIGVYTENSPVYFDNYEIKLVISFLQVINNPYDDVAIIALLRSPLFAFTPDELLDIRSVNNYDYIYNNMLKLNNSKIVSFLKKLDNYSSLSNQLLLYELINYLYNDTKFIAIISHMTNGKERVKNLLEMINHAKKFIDSDNYSLYDFINYLEKLIENKSSLMGTNPVSEKDNVLITTIHKSKGLEFPIVFLPSLDKKFNFQDLTQDILMDNDYYLGFKTRDYDNYTINSNLVLELLKKVKLKKQLSEELRVLYVALTRAKEKLIMSANVNKLDKKCMDINSLLGNAEKIGIGYLMNSKSYLDWLLAVSLKSRCGKDLRDTANVETKLYNDEIRYEIKIIDNTSLSSDFNIKQDDNYSINFDEIKEILDYDYPNQEVKYKTYTSVSELKKNNLNYLKPKFIDDGKQMKVGIIYHKIMEHLNFINYDIDNINIAIKELISNNFITKEELELISIHKITNFFMSDLYKNYIVNGDNHHEYSINFNLPLNLIESETDCEEEILVEGIIDLLCIYKNEYIIIDYKSDITNNDEDLINNYKKQLNLYALGIDKMFKNTTISKYIYSFNLAKFIKID